MFIPIGHEHTTVRRLPWVSFLIMALCVLAYILSALPGSGEGVIAERQLRALDYYFEHAYLELDERMKNHMYFTMRQYAGDPQPAPDNRQQVLEEQRELDRLVQRVVEALDEVPFLRWGLVPNHIRPSSVVSYMFMHVNLLHLFGNLFIFYLVGPFVEDVWGRALFAVFYLSAGAVSGLLFAANIPTSGEPLIGASGAVAGVMGAFLVRYWSTRLTFFYWVFFVRVHTGTFQAPAWAMLGLWGLRELFFATGGVVLIPGGDGNIAYWAHVYGFFFGVACAMVVRLSRFEQRFVDRALDRRSTVYDNTVVDQAVQLGQDGRAGEALVKLRAELEAHPANLDAAAALWHLAVAKGVAAEVVPAVLPVLTSAVRRGDLGVASTYWPEICRVDPDVALDPSVGIRLAELLHSSGDEHGATETVRWLCPRAKVDIPAAALIRLVRLSQDLGVEGGGRLVALARAHPALTPDLAAELDQLDAAWAEAPSGHTSGLRVIRVVPLAVTRESLEVKAGATRRAMKLKAIHAVAVAGIEAPGRRPMLILDLLLDPPRRPGTRVLRACSTDFDPRSVAGGETRAEGFRRLVEALLVPEGVVALPDEASARGRPYQIHQSVEDYESRVFGAVEVTS